MSSSDLGPSYKAPTQLEPQILPDANKYYSAELRRLVRRCVRYKPEDRIGVLELLVAIRRYTDPFSDDYIEECASGLRNEANDDGALELDYKADDYQVGLSMATDDG